MGSIYNHLSSTERATLMVMRIEGAGVRAIAREMDRDPSTISRELARNGACTDADGGATAIYDAVQAGARRHCWRRRVATRSSHRTRRCFRWCTIACGPAGRPSRPPEC